MRKLLFVLIALILLASFTSVLIHHHDDGEEHSDCAVCHLAKIVTGILILASIFVGAIFSSKRFNVLKSQFFNSLQLVSQLQSRAPPVLLS